jgi:predicted NBD/HSP70 family sugar kinase
MSIDPNGELCSCGRRGCWETFASERATIERFHRVTAKQGLPLVNLPDLIALANKNDPMALESIKITGEYLGQGISNLVHGIYPETVVIGGNITAAWNIIEPIIQEKLRSRYLIAPNQITVRPASVQRPSLFGAIPIALQNYFRSPVRASSIGVKAMGEI